MTLGIVDVGTNSIHLLIGILGMNGKFHVILKERDLTRLGEDGLARGSLTNEAMRRALAVLHRYVGIMTRCGVDHVEAVATSAVREASNGRAFVRRVRTQLGIPLRIISGREEARLIYLGVMQTHRFRRATLLVTIGGGSAQVIHGDGVQLRYATSVLLGGARLAQQFIRRDPPTAESLDALRRHVNRTWAPIARALHRYRWQDALGSSATIHQLMMAAYWQAHRRTPKAHEQLLITHRALRELVDWLSSSTSAERVKLDGLDPRREDLALPTGIALLGWMEACGVRRLRYAYGSIREGLVVDYLIRHHLGGTQRIEPPLSELFSADGISDLALPGLRRIARRAKRARRRMSHR